MDYGDFKVLARRIVSGTALHYKAFEILKHPEYD